ncbi:putative uncharacterized protein DDB_G0287457 [Condylostylus longicornis]|uniref:putative uncharacterized protein DDB_G0287457 n=1 Tax=Condylostylus longicornis TaxID=2530218 RepID=UPI00244DFA62|nr:putative uncharacterized protein DDB_G0287457 [Condylostylus longicornis]
MEKVENKSNLKSRTTNPKQFRAMIDLMKKYPKIEENGNQRTSQDVLYFWKNLSIHLNAMGPPKKDVTQWKKVWADYKYVLRKKLLAQKKLNMMNMNKKIKFTPLEREAMQLSLFEYYQEKSNQVKIFTIPKVGSTENENNSYIENAEAIDDRINYENNDESLFPIEFFSTPRSDSTENEDITIIENIEVVDRINEENNDDSLNPSLTDSHSESKTGGVKRKYKYNFENRSNCQEKLHESFSSSISQQNNNQQDNKIDNKELNASLGKLYEQNKITNRILQEQLYEMKRHNKLIEELAKRKTHMQSKILDLKLQKLKKIGINSELKNVFETRTTIIDEDDNQHINNNDSNSSFIEGENEIIDDIPTSSSYIRKQITCTNDNEEAIEKIELENNEEEISIIDIKNETINDTITDTLDSRRCSKINSIEKNYSNSKNNDLKLQKQNNNINYDKDSNFLCSTHPKPPRCNSNVSCKFNDIRNNYDHCHNNCEHELEIFGKSVGKQLMNLPLDKAYELEFKIQHLLTNAKLLLIKKNPISL